MITKNTYYYWYVVKSITNQISISSDPLESDTLLYGTSGDYSATKADARSYAGRLLMRDHEMGLVQKSKDAVEASKAVELLAAQIAAITNHHELVASITLGPVVNPDQEIVDAIILDERIG